MLRCLRLFLQLEPDVVHCHNPAPTLQAALSARLAGVRTILSTRHSLVAPPIETMQELKYNLMSLACDYIVGICEATCINLRCIPLALTDRIVRVYNGASPVVSESADLPTKSGFTLLFIGRLAEVKDLPTLINAVAIAVPRVPALHLWIVGDGKVRQQLEALAAQLSIGAHITFWGERHDVARFFSAADVFTMSSVSEGLPMSLLQAMSVSLPAIVTDVGGMAEVVRNSRCGLRVPVGDSAAYAEAIVQIAQDSAVREKFAANAIKAYGEHFTLEQMDAAYMDLYTRPHDAA
jgi:glycosyltransferase involved in cell wall biosynthesis